MLIPINRPRINKIYKLRKNQILYPEGIVTLNDTASKILHLCDGKRRIPEIKQILFDEYGGYDDYINNDINEMFLLFWDNKWIN